MDIGEEKPAIFVMRAVIEPPDDHPNKHLVSGERIPVVITMPGSFPWHEPWVGWRITDVVVEEESKLTWKEGRLVARGQTLTCIHGVDLTEYCDVCREGV